MRKLLVCGVAAFLLHSLQLTAQDYPDNSTLRERLQNISKSTSAATLTSLGKTEGNNDIWLLKIGKGDADNKPGIVITAGTSGYHLLGTELSLRFAEELVRSHQEALNTSTFYIFPNLSPDATAQYHNKLKYQREGNAVVADHDRDGQKNEDPYNDLNGDGLITFMRVESAMGDHKLSESDSRILVKADRKKGETGKYLLYTEGVDDDKDGKFNEDLKEGYSINKNFTYNFPVFEPLAGDYAVSQKETRLFIDYLFTQPNIYAFVNFGPENNLSAPLKYTKANADKRVVASILESDAAVNKMVSDIYNETIAEKAYKQDDQGKGGDLFEWAYFHFGRFSFSTPGWWIPEMKDENGDAKNGSEKKEKKDQGEISYEENFLKWAEKEGLNDVFVPWQKVEHPDFPGQTVEVGGVKPFVMTNPPFAMVDSIAMSHNDFIIKLVALEPKLEFHNVKTEKLNGGLTRVTADLYNNAPLPTHSELGERSRWLQKIKVTVNREKKDVIAGNTIALLGHLKAFEKKSYSWIVKGSGSLEIKAGAPHTGYAIINVKL